MGAILTQNTAWTQVRKSLDVLYEANCFTPEQILAIHSDKLAEYIRSAGYKNQKQAYLKAIAGWFLEKSDKVGAIPLNIARMELLSVKGVGPETADSILLYAYHRPTFVIDAYTRRICENLGIANPKSSYNELRSFFMDGLPEDVSVYQEMHALFVEHAKNYYRGNRKGEGCPLPALLRSA